MSAHAHDSAPAHDSIQQLLIQAETETKKDPRSKVRLPFFRLVSIEVQGRTYTAFTRDLCASSIGLLHNLELPLDEVDVIIPISTEQKCKMRVRIERCEPCGQGWYISGGKFVGITPAAELDDSLLDTIIAGIAECK